MAEPKPAARSRRDVALPLICATLTLIFSIWMWAPSGFAPRVSDERAYLMQADIFAQGHWKLPARPMPEFFEQEHTFVTPFVAAKYPPGQSMLLSLGALLRWPPLIPLLMAAASGALIILLARAVVPAPVAVLAWAIWLTLPPTVVYLPTYFSEVTTLFLWLMGWYSLLKRTRGGGAAWLVALAVCMAWGMITRPLTGLVYAIPTAGIAIWLETRRQSRRPLYAAIAAGALILLIIPLWSANTTGSWRTTPLMLYTRMYMPWDVPGFGLVKDAPERQLPADIQRDLARFPNLHAEHTVKNLPSIAAARAKMAIGMTSRTRKIVIVCLILVGISVLPRIAWIPLITSVLLFASYLSYASPPDNTLYTLEALPALAFAAAAGAAAILTFLLKRLAAPARASTIVLACMSLLAFATSVTSINTARASKNSINKWRRAIADLPTNRNLVFVKFEEQSNVPRLLVSNPPFLESSRTVVVFDRGAENSKLLSVFPNRRAYLLNVAAVRVDTAGRQ